MKLKLNKKTLKNLSKDTSVLPADMTPQVGGGITAAVNCPTDTTLPTTQINCNSDGNCGGGGDPDDPTFLCGWSDNCVSGYCITDLCTRP